MFFHPCRDVCQAAWDPCSYRWIIWSKWEIELCVISVEMVGETMCLYDGTQWCSVCGEDEGSKNWPLRNPSDQLMFCGYLPSPGHLERPTIESNQRSGLPVMTMRGWTGLRRIWWLSVKSGRQIQQIYKTFLFVILILKYNKKIHVVHKLNDMIKCIFKFL